MDDVLFALDQPGMGDANRIYTQSYSLRAAEGAKSDVYDCFVDRLRKLELLAMCLTTQRVALMNLILRRLKVSKQFSLYYFYMLVNS